MAELALAIIPLCLGAIKGIGIVRKKLKVLRHHDSEMKRLRKKFIAQTDIFLDEWQLLLQEVLDPEQAETLVENIDDPRWSSPDLNDGISAYLGRKCDDFRETVNEIKGHISSLSKSLNIDADNKPKAKNKGPARWESLDVMMNKSKYESSIDGFKEANQELKRLRKTASKIKHCQTKPHNKRPRPLPQSYQQVSHHSKSFYEALRNFWTCCQSQHAGHDVRLLIDNRQDGSLRVVVRYWTQSGFEVRSGLMDLWVRSQSLQSVHITLPTTFVPLARRDTGEERPTKARKVRSNDDCTSSSTVDKTISTHVSNELGAAKLLDLCSAKDMCSQLCAHTEPNKCGGYLDTPDQLRHYLSPVCGSSCDHSECLNTKMLGEPLQLDSIFRFPVERTLSVPDQIRLALKLVKGVLQFQSTPWLQPLWRLQDISYFKPADDLATALGTLHISSELSHSRQHDDLMAGAGDGMLLLREAQYTHGIRNLTMHSLGVALLQIGQWNTLQADDIAEVRRVADLSESGSRLGQRYQKITQQCLDCDFGFGKDLTQSELQSAIYRDVVCELEGLINTLEGGSVRWV